MVHAILFSSSFQFSSSINNNINRNNGGHPLCSCPEARKKKKKETPTTILVAANSRSPSSCSSSSSSGPSWNPKSMAEPKAAAEATANNNNNNKWAQKTITLPPHPRGCHLITPKILKEIGKELSEFQCGLAHFFLQHTSASLTINENYDSDVRHDTETFLNRIVPEGSSAPWQHTLEGPDDMPAHIKSSMFGCSLMIPISKGRLNMGTWQGIWLCEHRDLATPRKVVVTLNGI